MNTNTCVICLKINKHVLNLHDSDKNNVQWLSKLEFLIPELEWLETYVICKTCSKQLQLAWEFKKFVLDKEKTRVDKIYNVSLDLASDCIEGSYVVTDKLYLKKLVLKNEIEQSFSNSVASDSYLNGDQLSFEENKAIIKNEPNSYQCEKCSMAFSSIEELNSHSFSEHVPSKQIEVAPKLKKGRGRKPSRKFYCEKCNEEFDRTKFLIEHCVSIHGVVAKTVKPYSCEKCDMRFTTSANLHQHRSYHDKDRKHICSLCGKTFITKGDLTVHEYTHYNRRNYVCEVCDKRFNTNKNLRTHHLVVHTDRSLWKYGCSVCEKRFPMKTNYEQHFRRHTGKKEYACLICNKPFISRSELKKHMYVHSNIKSFKCTNCDKEYKNRRTYKAHLAKIHAIGNAKVTIREKKFVCHICPSQFYDKPKLMRHICSHTGLKPFSCYVCDKKFTTKSYVKNHLRNVHNIEEDLSNDITDHNDTPFDV